MSEALLAEPTAPTAQSANLVAALEYARLGKKVFPAHWVKEDGRCSCGDPKCGSVGKHPITYHGCRDASRSQKQVIDWWTKYPPANIGLPTGPENCLVVIDADIKHDGLANFNRLQFNHGFINAAAEANTGGGGKHLLYKYPANRVIKNSAGVLAPGVDVRGDGGYIIVAPSNHQSGGVYIWVIGKSLLDGGDLTDLPDAWLDLLSSPAKTEEKPPFMAPDVIEEGTRDNVVFRQACSWKAKGVSQRLIAELAHKFNQDRCKPQLSVSQVNKIVDNVERRYIPGQPIPVYTAEEDFADEALTGNFLQTYEPDDFTDAGAVEVFRRFVVGKLIWNDSSGYHCWDGRYWPEDPHAALRLGKALTDRMLQEARQMIVEANEKLTQMQISFQATDNPESIRTAMDGAKSEADHAKKFLAFVLKERQTQRIKAFTDLAKPYITVPGDRLNADAFILNTQSGIVNLRNGELRPHDPKALCTAVTAVAPSDEGASIWEDHLHTISCRDPELERYYQCESGKHIIGAVFEESMGIHIGAGRNGKSTHDNAQLYVVGPGYGGTINPEVLTTDKKNAGADLATLRGKRFIVAGELEEGKRLSISVLKRLTSTDPINAERKYYAPETFKPTHSTVLYTNFMPRLGSIDNGTTRRLRVVPFNAVIPADTEKKNYTQYLVDKAGGAILAWMIKGAEMFIKNDFRLPYCRAVEEASKEYIKNNDWMSAFLEECCDVAPGRTCAGGALYSAYTERAKLESEYPRRMNDLAAELRKRGFTNRKAHGVMTWEGLSIRSDWRMGRFYGTEEV